VDAGARIEALEAENERLRNRVEQLEAAEGLSFIAPPEWALTGREMRLFGVLMARDLATKNAIMTALYGDRIDEPPEIKIVDVFICKLRAKLKRFEVAIETVWGLGYRLSAESKAAVRARLAEGAA